MGNRTWPNPVFTPKMLRRFLNSVQQNARQTRWLFRISQSKRLRQKWLDSVQSEEGARPAELGKTCLLDIRKIVFDGEQGRRFHALVSMLSRGGYRVHVMPHLSFLQTGRKQFKWSALCGTVPYLAETAPKRFDLCLSDRSADHPLAVRTVKLAATTTRSIGNRDIPMPYSHHPLIWDLAEDRRFDEYRRRPRRWRLFFGGNCQIGAYGRIKKYKRLKTIDRYSLLQLAFEHFGSQITRVVDEVDFQKQSKTQHPGFVVIDSDDYRIPPQKWMGALSIASFMLAAPGCDYPLSHNCVEAMAVGTIPVLEYDALFYPALQDGVNCIAFRGQQGFLSALERVETMSEEQVASIRAGVIEYYQSHLSPESLCRDLESSEHHCLHMFPYL